MGFSYSGVATAEAGYSNQTGYLTFTLVRSWNDTPPSTVTTTSNPWETTPGNTGLVLQVPITAAGPITWGTNLSQEVIGRANWIGIYAVTNTTQYFLMTNATTAGPRLNLKVNGVRLR